jgi:hypothetical protein
MLRPIPLKDLDQIDLVPHAVIRKPVSYFQKLLGVKFFKLHDELDAYEGAAFSLDDGLPLALRHYHGHPADTTTVYLARELRDIGEISRIIARIVEDLKLPRTAVDWQRSDNPDL